MFNFPKISKIFQVLLRKPLIHLRNVCLVISGCMLIKRHFDHVNEAEVQVYQWFIGIITCTGVP